MSMFDASRSNQESIWPKDLFCCCCCIFDVQFVSPFAFIYIEIFFSCAERKQTFWTYLNTTHTHTHKKANLQVFELAFCFNIHFAIYLPQPLGQNNIFQCHPVSCFSQCVCVYVFTILVIRILVFVAIILQLFLLQSENYSH